MKGYTNYAPDLKALMREHGTDDVSAYVEHALQHLAFIAETEPEHCSAARNAQHLCVMEASLLCGRTTHIFMPDRTFCDWLVSCVPSIITYAYAKTLAASFGVQRHYCMHFPVGNGFGAFIMVVTSGADTQQRLARSSPDELAAAKLMGAVVQADAAVADTFRCILKVGKGFLPRGSADLLTIVVDRANSVDLNGDGGILDYYGKLVIALGLYLDCFPEQLKDGVPVTAKLGPQDYPGPMHHIGIADAVRATGPRTGGWTATPHYRSGHFRLLKADRYVNKKGMTVFVKPCFVHGKAETVQDLEGRPCTTMEAVNV